MTLEKLFIESPLIEAPLLSKELGCKVYLKLDNLQPSGSFKIRGISYQIAKAMEQFPVKTIVSSSGGNAGMAATVGGKSFGLDVHVFVPETTPVLTIDRLKGLGAHVTVHGPTWNEAHAKATEYIESLPTGSALYIHPFDHPDLWQGHSTLVDEVVHIKPDYMICSVGGGGLLAGILTGLIKHQADTHVIAVETIGAESFYKAMEAGRPVLLDDITSIAKSLGAKQVADGLMTLVKQYGKSKVTSMVVSDKQALNALEEFANDYRLLVEPACAASLAIVLQGLYNFKKGSTIIVEVCGGSQVDLTLISNWKNKLDN